MDWGELTTHSTTFVQSQDSLKVNLVPLVSSAARLGQVKKQETTDLFLTERGLQQLVLFLVKTKLTMAEKAEILIG